MSFPPLVVPVTSSFEPYPVKSTFSYEHNESLPSSIIHTVPVYRDADKQVIVRKGDLISFTGGHKDGYKRSMPHKSYEVTAPGDNLKNASGTAVFPVAEAMTIEGGKKISYISIVAGGVRDVVGHVGESIVPGDPLYAKLQGGGGKIKYELTKSPTGLFMGHSITCMTGTQSDDIATVC